MTGVQGNPQEAPASPEEERLRSSSPLDARAASPRGRTAWTVALTVLSAGALLAANAHGRGARVPFVPPPELDGGRVLSVKDAAEAVLVWRSAELRGRHLVVLTGRWSRPQSPARPPEVAGGAPGPARGPGARARRAERALRRRGHGDRAPDGRGDASRRARAAALGGERPEGAPRGRRAAFRLPADGFDRRFSTPEAFEPPSEPVLVLVEPSWFAAGAPPEPLAWLASTGVSADLVVLALEDPAAGAEERSRAVAYADAARAVRAELGE